MNTNITADAGFAIKHYKNKTTGEGAEAKSEPRPDPYYSIIGKDKAGNVVAIRVEQAAGEAALDALLSARLLASGEEAATYFGQMRTRIAGNLDAIEAEVVGFLDGEKKRLGVRAAKAPVVEDQTA